MKLSIIFILLIFCLPLQANVDAASLYSQADKLQAAGDLDNAHEIFRRAAAEFEKQGDDAGAAVCYYSLAISYLNQRDTMGMSEVLSRLERLRQKHPDNSSINFDYYSVLSTRMVVEYENLSGGADADTIREQMINYQKLAARYMEQISADELSARHVHPVWAYYNIAVMYDLYYDPIVLDSVRHYLDLAENARNHAFHLQYIDLQEADISILDERAWLAYYDGDMTEARRYMQQVLALIDTVSLTRANSVLTERCQAYEFMAMITEEEGRVAESLTWQKKLNDANRERYNVEQNESLHEVEARYKKREQDQTINSLRRQNMLLVAVSATLMLVFCLAFLIYRLKRKNREQEQYEQAVEAAMPMVGSNAESESISIDSLRIQLNLLCHDFTRYAERLGKVNLEFVADICSHAVKTLSVVDLRYLICFLTDLSTGEIAEMFSVEPSSIYIARYRLRRKFPNEYKLPL